MVLDHVPVTLDFGCTCTVFGIAIAGRSLDFGYGCFSLNQEYRGAVIDEILLFDKVLLRKYKFVSPVMMPCFDF
ncbi:hypothetical protein BRADI_3g26846v3 [Brachypodium distachyon]|uniref:Uncharacterized protein n=1 Tax=Brachypodium distachyon TaxID=15368 RepID=A0A2K2CZD3_BRADI|nr:hypothetical protein BRADI_3g26846v3 [Brachypodium distachyon]